MIEDTMPPQVSQKTLNGTTRNVMMVRPPYLLLPLFAWIILCFYDQSDNKNGFRRIIFLFDNLNIGCWDVEIMLRVRDLSQRLLQIFYPFCNADLLKYILFSVFPVVNVEVYCVFCVILSINITRALTLVVYLPNKLQFYVNVKWARFTVNHAIKHTVSFQNGYFMHRILFNNSRNRTSFDILWLTRDKEVCYKKKIGCATFHTNFAIVMFHRRKSFA